MEWSNTFLTFVGGLLVRLGIPVLLTILATWWLRRLDEHWQREVEEEEAVIPTAVKAARQVNCWEAMGCPPTKREACVAYLQPEIPCFQHFCDANGNLQAKCNSCKVHQAAVIPVRL